MKSESRKDLLEVERVLMQLATGDRSAPWEIQRIGQGDQAQLFLANSEQAFVAEPVVNTVVVKLYKQPLTADRQAFLSEKHGLKVLRELLSGNVCDGWSIRSPALLHVSENPLALVMSSLPGVPLDLWLHSNVPSCTEAESIAEAILASLRVLWSQGFMYGDLNLKNILYDPAQRTLGFIDPGLPVEYYRCDEVTQDWFPMSRDIAYLLFSVAVSIKSTLRNPTARRRQQLVVSLLVQRYFQSIGSRQQQTMLLNEIRLCIETHLRELNGSWSPSGIWRRLVKQLTQSNLNRTLEHLAVLHNEVQV